MNQVTEMPRLFDAARIDDSLARLDSLFEIMLRQPGFLRAEVLRSLDDPRRLLVLHAWRDLADWQRFQSSETKIAFTNARPAALYEFLPCPMNWLATEDTGEPSTPILRRELVRADRLEALNGDGIVSSTTYVYQDDAPEFRGLTMRLTRYAEAPKTPTREGAAARDETFESLLQRSAALNAASTAR
jgi:heme-degrading monooxygenase HmoA